MDKAEKILNIATKRGFFYPTAEYYGAKAGFWTYGHLGTLMKHKWQNLWRKFFLSLNDNYYEIEGSSILPEKVFESSGHLKNFNDPLTECKQCHFRFRADQYLEDELKINVDGLSDIALNKLIKDNKLKCVKCGGPLTDVKWFNMMFDVKIGATGEDLAYLSPETAQNPFLSFKRQFLAQREKLPLGLAMIGKAFRNEIAPRQGFFRLREFTQAELQIFFDPADIETCESWDNIKKEKLRVLLAEEKKKIVEITAEELQKKYELPKFYLYHMVKIQEFYLKVLEIPKEKFRFRELSKEERAFYNKIHFDIELDLETLGGFKEVAGLHFRGSYDLTKHQEGSGEKLEVTINENGTTKRLIPNVLEVSFGVDRNIWALLDIFFKEEKERTLFTFSSKTAPIEVAVFPLVKKDKLPEKAREIYNLLKEHFTTSYDESGSIGRMYRRVDELGVSAMITIDHQTLKDKTITLRDRNSMKQIRVKTKELVDVLQKYFCGEKLEKLGKVIS